MSYTTSTEDMLSVYTRNTYEAVAAKYLRYDEGRGDYVIVNGQRLVVPLTYDPQQARALANQILEGNADRVTQSGGLGEMSGYHGVLADMYNAARAGGPIDLQRNYNGNNGSGDFVEAFTPAASYNYGLFGSAAGLPNILVEAGGGIYNLIQRTNNPNVELGLNFGNNPRNDAYIQAGIRDAYQGIDLDHLGATSQIPHCFAAGTPIAMADGSIKEINKIFPDDLILAFDTDESQGRGDLVPRRVARVFRNVTEEIVSLDGVMVTSGHHVLTENAGFLSVAEALARGERLIDAEGRPVRPRVERFRFGQAGAPDFEVATDLVAMTEHGLALAPEWKTGWRTYNFEVEGLHTYVAGGLRVHNTSALDFIPDDIRDDPSAYKAVLAVDDDGVGRSREVAYEDRQHNLHIIDTEPGVDGNSILKTETVVLSGGESGIEHTYVVQQQSTVDAVTRQETGTTVTGLSRDGVALAAGAAGTLGASLGSALGAALGGNSLEGRAIASYAFGQIGSSLGSALITAGSFTGNARNRCRNSTDLSVSPRRSARTGLALARARGERHVRLSGGWLSRSARPAVRAA